MTAFDKKIIHCICGIMSNTCDKNKRINYYHDIIKHMYGYATIDKMQELTDYSFDWDDADEDALIDFLKEDEEYGYIVDDYGKSFKEVVEQIQEERCKKLEREFTFV